MSYQETFPDTISTNAIKKPSSPQIIIENPLRKNIFVNSIQLSFDAYFSEKGVIMIEVNDNIILPPKKAGSFKRLQNFSISLKNQEFFDRKKIKVYAWNGTDTDFVSVGVDVQISEDPNTVVSPDAPLSLDSRNSAISDSEIIFENKVYFNQVIEKLINMQGYKKLIVSMSSSTVPDLSEVSKTTDTGNTISTGVSDNVCTVPPVGYVSFDGSGRAHVARSFSSSSFPIVLPMAGKDGQNLDETNTVEVIYDLNTEEAHTLEFTFTNPADQFGSVQKIRHECVTNHSDMQKSIRHLTKIKISHSSLPSSGFSTVQNYGSDEADGQKVYGGITKRYVKVEFKVETYQVVEMDENAGGTEGSTSFTLTAQSRFLDPSVLGTNPFDQNTKGGTASLSFLEKDLASSTFTELIPSSEFGTITEGQAVKEQIGDVNNVSVTEKSYFLPSTQTNFQAKLTVTGGGIETGVSITKVQ